MAEIFDDIKNKPQNILKPTLSKDRIHILDVLRSFSLIGILLMNIEWFNRPIANLGSFDTSLYSSDYAVGWLIRFFIEGKIYKLFALLFGMGFAIMLLNAQKAEKPIGALFSRRMFFLYIIGLAHLIFLWGGDILHDYAFTGFILLGWMFLLKKEFFKRFSSPSQFLKIALFMILFQWLIPFLAGFGYGATHDKFKLTSSWQQQQKVQEKFLELKLAEENKPSLEKNLILKLITTKRNKREKIKIKIKKLTSIN